MNAAATPTHRVGDFLQALRPNQWTKNFVVLAAYFFAFGDHTQVLPANALATVVVAALLFCVASSGIYVLNDLLDRRRDVLHPVKRNRPIAAGRIYPGAAATLSAILLVAGTASAFALSRRFGTVVSVYVVMQILYTIWLKQVALVDTMVIASGFVLRALGGGVVIGVVISPWLLLCAFLLALFLALCKRRFEKVALEDQAANHRPSLQQYDAHLLDQLISIVSSATVVCYAIYTLWPNTVEKFGTDRLVYTVPLVIFGVFRYLDLVYRHEQGGTPERVLMTDKPLLADLAAYALAVLAIFILAR